MYNKQQARDFAEKWLPAWTGNNPELLTSFYTKDAFYSDPTVPRGIEGEAALLSYFGKLLANNPHWIWTHSDSSPMQDGFVNFWHASIPVGDKSIEVDGVCLVQLRDGLIYSNKVFFDTHQLMTELSAHIKKRRQKTPLFN